MFAVSNPIVVADVGLDGLAELDTEWNSDATFVVVPQRCGITPEALRRSLAALPADLQTDHFVLLSSGSTGEPKLVVGSRRRAEALAAVLHRLQSSEEVEESLLLLPPAYSYAFVNQWVWSRVHQRRLVPTVGLRDPAALRESLHRADRAMLCLVAPQLALLAAAFPEDSFSGVIRVHFAGGRFPQERLAEVRRLFPRAEVYNNYGCVEAMPRLTLRPAAASNDGANIGLPLPGVELRVDDDQALQFRSPFRAVAAIERERLTRYDDSDWLPTGDLAEQQPAGTWRLLGRRAEVYKRHGEKVQLATLTAAVAQLWNGQAVIRREPDPTGEEGHVLVLAPHPPGDEVRAILSLLRTQFRRPYWPLRIESVARIPQLPNGKLDAAAAATADDRRILWTQRI